METISEIREIIKATGGLDRIETFVEETGNHTLNPVGTARLTTTSPYSGTASLLLDADSAKVSTTPNLNVGTGDFYMGGWFNFDDNTVRPVMGYSQDVFFTVEGIQVFIDESSRLMIINSFDLQGGGQNPILNDATAPTVPVGVWTHIAMFRKDGVLYLARDGNHIGQPPGVAFAGALTGTYHIGGSIFANSFRGKVDSFYVEVGSSPYDENNFTPPTGQASLGTPSDIRSILTDSLVGGISKQVQYDVFNSDPNDKNAYIEITNTSGDATPITVTIDYIDS